MKKIKHKPTILSRERTLFVDCDETLVLTEYPDSMEKETIEIKNFGVIFKVLPHKKHIKILKQFKARGFGIVVWSNGGSAWAKVVVENLKLNEYVDIILSKPSWIVDDLPASSFIPEINRIYKPLT